MCALGSLTTFNYIQNACVHKITTNKQDRASPAVHKDSVTCVPVARKRKQLYFSKGCGSKHKHPYLPYSNGLLLFRVDQGTPKLIKRKLSVRD